MSCDSPEQFPPASLSLAEQAGCSSAPWLRVHPADQRNPLATLLFLLTETPRGLMRRGLAASRRRARTTGASRYFMKQQDTTALNTYQE